MEGEKNQQKLRGIKINQFWLIVFALAFFAVSASSVGATSQWTGPNGPPPGNNVAKPLNEGTEFGKNASPVTITGYYNDLSLEPCPTANQVYTWDGTKWVCGTAVGKLLDVLNAGADASAYNSGVKIGNTTGAWLNLGGALTAGWLHATQAGDNDIVGNLKVSGDLNALSGISFNPDINAYKITVSAANALGFRSTQYFLWAAGVDPTFSNSMMALWNDGTVNRLDVNGDLRLKIDRRAVIPGGVDFNESPQLYKIGVEGTAANALKFAAPIAFLWGFSGSYSTMQWTDAPLAFYKDNTNPNAPAQLIVRGQICLPDTSTGNCISSWADASGYWSKDANNNIYNNNSGGKVAIGTNNPVTYAKLLVSMGTSNLNEGIHITRGVSGSYDYSYLNIEDQAASPVFRVNQNGQVGIGTASPGSLLELYKSAAANQVGPTMRFMRNLTGGGFGSAIWSGHSDATSDYLAFGVKNNGDPLSNEKMRIINSGYVGIGTAAPVSALNVAGTTGLNWAAHGTSLGLVTVGTAGSGGSLWINTPSNNGTYASGLGISGTYASLRSIVNIGAYGSKFSMYGSELAFSTTNGATSNEAMRIDESGNVGIGTNNPGYKLSVQGGDGNNPGISLTSGAANTGTFYAWGRANATDGGLLGVAGAARNYWAYAAPGDTVLRAGSGNLNLTADYNNSGMTINTAGNVLIGSTILPMDSHGNIAKLFVHAATNANIGILDDGDGVAWLSAYRDDATTNVPLRLNSSEFRFYNSDTQFATLNNSSGNNGNTAKLEVNGIIKLGNTARSSVSCDSSHNENVGAIIYNNGHFYGCRNLSGVYIWRQLD